jgi:hypothetical protein
MSHQIAPRTVSSQLVEQSLLLVDCSIPPDLTIDEWRRQRPQQEPRPTDDCEHLCDTTSRYDHARKELTFLLVCPVCQTEKVLETMAYEPSFEPRVATVHPFPRRRRETPARRAA